MESQLERFIEADPAILGEPLLLIGRQVPTSYGKLIDLLALDAEGTLHVLELKRDRTPREVVAQVLDYGSWAAELSHQQVPDIFTSYRDDTAFEQAFAERFGSSPPEELNTAQRLTIIAHEVDPGTERIVTYLNEGYGVPINVLFFRYYLDGDREYLARTWLIDEIAASSGRKVGNRVGKREEWNLRDWYVSFGELPDGRNWDDARRYGFVSAGGGSWFSRTLRGLPIGARVFVCIPKTGYVGAGVVTAEAARFNQAMVDFNGADHKLGDLPLAGKYHGMDDDDTAEYVVPVSWIRTVDQTEAIWQRGLFANQNSACKLRNRFTIDTLERAFDIEGEDD